MDALGDSFTRAWGTNGSGDDFPARSYSTGTDAIVNSLYQRIRAGDPAIDGKNYNDAADGSYMLSLSSQVQNAVGRRVDFVTVLAGVVDVCLPSTEAGMTPVDRYRAQFQEAMDAFSTGLPNGRVLVVSVPDMYQVWAALKDNPAARSAWIASGFCSAMFANPLSTDQADVDRRARVRQRIVDYNTQLAQVCAQYTPCRFDNNTVFNLGFVASDVSTVDYGHPSVQWQAKVAQALWAYV